MVGLLFLGESEPFVPFQERKKKKKLNHFLIINRELARDYYFYINIILIATLFVTSSSIQQWSNLHELC